MERKHRNPLLIVFTVLMLILSDCRKDDKYDYFEDYVGNWQFRVYRMSRGGEYYSYQYDTIYHFGSISKLGDNRGLSVNYLNTVSVWVENDTILRDAGKLGVIKNNEIRFGFTSGSLYYATFDEIYGVKQNIPGNINKSPSALTTTATGVTQSGSMLRGVVNAGSFSVDIEFEYGTSESYGNTVKAIPGKAECDMEIYAKAYVSDLEPSAQYHFRIKVTSSAGTVYGDDMTFTTTGYSDPVTDLEGNVYKTIQIGAQIWMAENLKATKYNNGDTITYIKNNASLSGLKTGAYCYYNNIPGYKDMYGALYNFYAVADNRNLCPSGWHVPAGSDWTALLTILYPNSAARMKESGVSHMLDPDTGADNSSGFTAVPGGAWGLSYNQFSGMDNFGRWWSSTGGSDYSAKCLEIHFLRDFAQVAFGSKEQFYSLRCLKD